MRWPAIASLALVGCSALARFHPGDAGTSSETPARDVGVDAAPLDLSPAVDAGPFDPTQWRFRKRLTIGAGRVSSDLHDFPLLVALDDGDLAGETAADGSDIAFVLDSDLSRQLPHEIEAFAADTGRLVAWVSVPILAAADDTVLYLYYGSSEKSYARPSEVWLDYGGVWHLSGDLSGGAADSTANGNHLQTRGSFGRAQQQPGRIAGSVSLDGATQWLFRPSTPALAPSSQMTLSVWCQVRSFSLNLGTLIAKATKTGTGNLDYLLRAGESEVATGFHSALYNGLSGSGWTGSGWHHVASTFDGAQLRLFLDGQLVDVSSVSGPIRRSARPLNIGSFGELDATRLWNGQIDEVRVSATARSPHWIAASYANQQSPKTFYTVGPAEQL